MGKIVIVFSSYPIGIRNGVYHRAGIFCENKGRFSFLYSKILSTGVENFLVVSTRNAIGFRNRSNKAIDRG